jgi:hypothetical protein
MANESKMKSESLDEQRDRLKAMSDAEKRGAEAASEGQLIPERGQPTDPDSIEGQELQRVEESRVRKSTQDYRDEDVRSNRSSGEEESSSSENGNGGSSGSGKAPRARSGRR